MTNVPPTNQPSWLQTLEARMTSIEAKIIAYPVASFFVGVGLGFLLAKFI